MSKVLVDKSGIKKQPVDPIESRIKKIHLKPAATAQDLLQPIEPNFERSTAVQLKQLPHVPSGEKLEMEKAMLDDLRKTMESLKNLPKEDVNEVRKLLRQLPSIADFKVLGSLTSGDPISMIKALAAKERELTRKDKAVETAKEKKDTRSDQEIRESLKKNQEKRKKLEADQKITTHTGQKKVVKTTK